MQGLALRPGTNQMWSVEHGPSVNDEINLLVAGGNYGWDPVPGYSEGVPMTDLVKFPDAIEAKWSSGYPTLATSGAIFLEGSRWGDWEGRLAVASLKNQSLRLFEFAANGTLMSEVVVPELDGAFGRLRTPMLGPDGALYVSTSNGGGVDRILRIAEDNPVTVTLKLTPDSIGENGGVSLVKASLDRASNAVTTVMVTAAAVAPAVPGDFTLSENRTLTIAAGAMSSTGVVTVRAVNNNVNAPNKTVTISATADNSNGVMPPSAVTLKIIDDDDAPPRPPPSPPGPRTSAPGAPRNLTAVGGDGQVVLSWDAPASDGGAEITDYEYRINGRNPWISTGSTDTTYTVSGLVNGTAYVFEVRAVNSVGKSFAPNQVEAAPEAPEVFTLDFAHFANGEGTTSDLVFVNVGTQPVRPALYFYDTEGALVSAESVVDITGDLAIQEDGALTVLTAVEPLGELTISTHGQGDLVSGSVKVVSDGPIGGMLRFDLPAIGEAVVGASPPVSDALFAVRRQEGGITTGVAIHNLEEEPMEVVCELMQTGVLLDAVSLPLEANGQTAWLIDAAFPAADTSDFVGSVQCDAVGEGLFSALALEMDPGTRVFLTLPLFPVDRGGGGPEAALDFAHFANGDGTTSDLVFVNVSTQRSRPAPTPFHTDIPPILPAIYFYDTEGHPIAAESVVDITGDLEIREDGGLTVQTEMEPLGVLTISTHGRGALVSGSVKVIAVGPIGGMLRFDLPAIGEAVVGASPPVSDAIFPVRRRAGGITTGVALHNLESSPGLLRCDLLREGVRRDAASFPLEANGQTSWLIDQAFPTADTSDFAGSVRCDAVGEGRFSAVALEMDPGTRIFTTLPVVPVPEMPDRE